MAPTEYEWMDESKLNGKFNEFRKLANSKRSIYLLDAFQVYNAFFTIVRSIYVFWKSPFPKLSKSFKILQIQWIHTNTHIPLSMWIRIPMLTMILNLNSEWKTFWILQQSNSHLRKIRFIIILKRSNCWGAHSRDLSE